MIKNFMCTGNFIVFLCIVMEVKLIIHITHRCKLDIYMYDMIANKHDDDVAP